MLLYLHKHKDVIMELINKKDIKNLEMTILYTSKEGETQTTYLSTDYDDFNKMFNALPNQEDIKIEIVVMLGEKTLITKEVLKSKTAKDFDNYSLLIKKYFKRIKKDCLKAKPNHIPFLMQMAQLKDGTRINAVVTPIKWFQ